MFSPIKISEKLYGLVGFRQPFNPAYQKIDAGNQASRSGYFVTDNPFAKLEYIYDSQDFSEISDIDFNIFLKRKQEESIVSIANAVFNSADYIDRQMFYKNASNKINTETLPTGFIGYRIEVSDKKNIAFSIKRILLEFSGTGTITIMLFNTAKAAPILSQVVNITSTHQEVVLDWTIDNSDTTYKGDYYLGYLTTGLTVAPFKRDYQWSNLLSIISELSLLPIVVKNHLTATLFDLLLVEGNNKATGLNPDVTVYEDFTDLIIQNEKLFARAIQLDMQISFLSEYIASLRSNRNERSSAQLISRIMQEIEGETGENNLKVTGLRPQLYRSISSIKKEVQKLKESYFGKEILVDTLN